ncbi:MAG: ABC transporter permease [Chitinophagaceae bacterium]
MIKNYFKIAFRNLWKNKTYSIINILGLTLGLVCFLLIALYVFDEMTFDGFHKSADNIYRLIDNRTTPEGTQTRIAGAGYQVSEKVKTDLPGVKDAVRLLTFGRANVAAVENTNVFYEPFRIGNPAFLTMFDFPLLRGDRKTALTDPHSVIITEETAQKFFKTNDVLGKALKVDRDSVPFKITAILKNFPVNSHISFNVLFSESSMTSNDFKKFANADWNSDAFTTYLLLNDKKNVRGIETKIDQLVAANETSETHSKSSFHLQRLKDIHFYSDDIEGSSGKKGNIAYIYVFSIVALFVLLIACINYMNLTTARFTNRAKEIAVRKVAGASRKSLAKQFLSEAFVITIIAVLVALALVKFLLPWFNSFTEKQLLLGKETDYRIWVGIGLIVLVVGLLSGIYPALFQSRLAPLLLLKNKINVGKSTISIRRSLVVFQFALSITMIVATMIVYQQMKYISAKDMGFNKDQLLVVDINSGKVRRGAETIKTEFGKIAQVKEVSVSSRVPGEWKDLPKIKVKNEKILTPGGNDMYFIGADDKFLTTYQIKLLKGRNFRTGSQADSSSVLINESAAKELGIADASGQVIEIPLETTFHANVIGIVNDFNFQSLRQPLAPMVLGFRDNPIQNIDYFTAKVSAGNMSETLKQMDAVLHSIDQNHLFEYHFLDKQWDNFYREDEKRQTIFLAIAIMTIFIACLGLFGLATYAAEQRIKEIGIRKVLGASVMNIVGMLSKDFLKLVAVAALLAIPVAWWMMNSWLHDFAYRTKIYWWVFAIAGTIALLIALCTVSMKALKAAITNPVKSLRTE